MGEEALNKVLSIFDKASLPYELLKHDRAHSVDDASKVRGSSVNTATKALILKGSSGNFFLVVIEGDKRVSFKKVKKIVGERNVRMASPDEVLTITGCEVGSVTPIPEAIGFSFDRVLVNKGLLDRSSSDRELMFFSAGTHFHSVKIRSEDFLSLFPEKVIFDVEK